MARSLANLGRWYLGIKAPDQGVAATTRAIDLFSAQIGKGYNQFDADMSVAYCNRALCLEALLQPRRALTDPRKGIDKLRPEFLNYPLSVKHWMKPMLHLYTERCRKLGVEPDAALLGPIDAVFERLESEAS